MGVQTNVGFKEFPKQGGYLGKKCQVCFHYDTRHQIEATVVREDREEPGVMILALADGRFVLSTECMYTPPR